MSCAWAKIEKPEPISLKEIISQEVAKELQTKQEQLKQYQEINAFSKHFEAALETPIDISCDILRAISDTLDREKAPISPDNCQGIPLTYDFESDSDEEKIEDINIKKQWNQLDTLEFEFASVPSFYKIQKRGKFVTTYAMNTRKKNDELPSSPNLNKEDKKKFDLKLSNELFDSLKWSVMQKKGKGYNFLFYNEHDHIMTYYGLDEYTRFLLYNIIDKQVLEQINDVLNIGKEAVILHAYLNPSFPYDRNLSKECVIKIFRGTNLQIKRIDHHIKDNQAPNDRLVTEKDKLPKYTMLCRPEMYGIEKNLPKCTTWYRKKKKLPPFVQRDNTLSYNSIGKQATKRAIRKLAANEMYVLIRLQKAQVPCPKFIKLKKHILVMSFIGENHTAAPLLRDANMTTAEYVVAYNQVIEGMKTMFEKANVIHTELLDNILWHQGQCYFVDFSLSVESNDPQSFLYLFDDCTKVTDFFTKTGIPNVQSEYDLFKYITGLDFINKLDINDVKE